MPPRFLLDELTQLFPRVVLRPGTDFRDFAQMPVDQTHELDAVDHGIQIVLCIAVALVEVVEVDLRPLQRIRRAQRDASGAILGVGLQHGPGEAVALPFE